MHLLNVYSIQYAYGAECMAREQWHEMWLFAEAKHRIYLFSEGPYVLVGMKFDSFERLGVNKDDHVRIQEHEHFNFVFSWCRPDNKIKLRCAVTKGISDNLDRITLKTDDL